MSCVICTENISNDEKWSCQNEECTTFAHQSCVQIWFKRGNGCPICKVIHYNKPKARDDGIQTYRCRLCGGTVPDDKPIACQSCEMVCCRSCFKTSMDMLNTSMCPLCEEHPGFIVDRI